MSKQHNPITRPGTPVWQRLAAAHDRAQRLAGAQELYDRACAAAADEFESSTLAFLRLLLDNMYGEASTEADTSL